MTGGRRSPPIRTETEPRIISVLGFSPEAAARILRELGFSEPYAGRIGLPESCELVIREKDGTPVSVRPEFRGDDSAEITVKQPCTDAVTGALVHGPLTLPPYDVRVFAF